MTRVRNGAPFRANQASITFGSADSIASGAVPASNARKSRAASSGSAAVSRVRTIGGLNFKEWFKGVHVSPEAIEFYKGAE